MRIVCFDAQAEFYADRLRDTAPDAVIVAAQSPDEAIAALPGAEVLIALAPRLTPAVMAAATDVKWIQALTTGVDNIAGYPGIALTNCHGIHGPQMSELAVMVMLASLRNFPRMLVNQRMAVWDRWPQPLLSGRTACIVGVGAISEHLAQVLRVLGMKVTGVTSRRDVDGFDHLYTRMNIQNAVASADFVVVLSPYTPANRNIVDANVIGAMPATAHLINLSRGGCVDEAAVIRALIDGRIAGAALDVFDQEPLPTNSPLWSVPNLIITPHLGGFSDVYHEQALPILQRNLQLYLDGGADALKDRIK